MSIRNKRIQSPVKRYLEYRASTSKNGKGGMFYYYDKETKKNVDVTLPITFVDISSYYTITGWSDSKGAIIYSNEVASTKTPLTVKYRKKGTMCHGLYKDVKDMIKANGGRFAVVIYAIMDKEVVKILLKGKAMSSWLEKPSGDYVTISGTTQGKKGATVFEIPTIEARELTDDELATIQDSYAHVFTYLDARDASPMVDDELTEMDAAVQVSPEDEPQQSVFETMTDDDLELQIEKFKMDNEEEEISITEVPF